MASIVGQNSTAKIQEVDVKRIRQYRPEVGAERASIGSSPDVLSRRAADLVESAVGVFLGPKELTMPLLKALLTSSPMESITEKESQRLESHGLDGG